MSTEEGLREVSSLVPVREDGWNVVHIIGPVMTNESWLMCGRRRTLPGRIAQYSLFKAGLTFLIDTPYETMCEDCMENARKRFVLETLQGES